MSQIVGIVMYLNAESLEISDIWLLETGIFSLPRGVDVSIT